jgi:D-alanyl-lipoteichoic acid acyltransferase DltB (MBOAT superfamily)
MQQFLQQFLYDPKNPLLFSSGFFVYYFTAFIALYYKFQHNYKARTWLFCFFSLYFFYKASGAFVLLVVASAIVDFFLGNLIYQVPSKPTKKVLLIIGIIFNLGILTAFKYTNFFIEIINAFLQQKISPLHILLPAGISFYTFESISYMVDVYRRKILPARRFADYLLFLSFFPKLVMGPIVRASDFLPQISKPYFVSKEQFSSGFFLIVTGLFKKLIISDYISANLVNFVFEDPSKYTGIECLTAMYGFAVVIYCDFSGYSSIAIGLAKWLGFNIPENFNEPYKSQNITAFWQRWHISLSSWLKDYLYIPLGGNRKGEIRKYINLFITMLLGGLWHGANVTFVIWGAMHGVALGVHKLFSSKSQKVLRETKDSLSYKLLSIFFTFHFVCISWVFFRADSLQAVSQFFKQLKYNFKYSHFNLFWQNYNHVVLMIILGMALHLAPKKITEKINEALKKEGLLGYVLLFGLFIILLALFKSAEPIMPIYLQF